MSPLWSAAAQPWLLPPPVRWLFIVQGHDIENSGQQPECRAHLISLASASCRPRHTRHHRPNGHPDPQAAVFRGLRRRDLLFLNPLRAGLVYPERSRWARPATYGPGSPVPQNRLREPDAEWYVTVSTGGRRCPVQPASQLQRLS